MAHGKAKKKVRQKINNHNVPLFQDAGLLPIFQHPIGINLEIVGLLVSFV